MKKLIKKLYKKFAILSAMVAICATLALPVLVHAQNVGTPSFRSGDIVTAVNNTTRNADWADSVNAEPGQIIEFRIMVQNMQADSVAKDVLVRADWPQTAAKSLRLGMNANANGVTVSDTATVNVTGDNTYLLAYAPGHTRVFSPGCPNGCNADDAFLHGRSINVGDLAFGESAQVLFKAGVTNPLPGPTATPTAAPTVAPTATPTVAPTATPTSAPTVAPTATPTGAPNNNVQCPSGTHFDRIEGNNIICINNSNVNNNTNNNSVNVTNTVNAPSSAPGEVRVLAAGTSNVKQLPKTGLPLAGLALAGLAPIGMKLRKSGKAREALTPNFMWAQREFEKES